MFGSGVVSYADKVDDLKKEKQNQEQNVENKKKSIQDMTTEKDAAFKEIVEKQKRIEQLDKDLTDLEDLINKISEEIQASIKQRHSTTQSPAPVVLLHKTQFHTRYIQNEFHHDLNRNCRSLQKRLLM